VGILPGSRGQRLRDHGAGLVAGPGPPAYHPRVASNRFTAFDAVMIVLGSVFFALSAVAVVATITVLASWSTVEADFPAGPGFIRFAKGFSLVFFPLTALVTFATGWWLAGDQIKRLRRRRG
jgi:hypothetical protein